jgi:uncharacterized phage protein gp47/JayE
VSKDHAAIVEDCIARVKERYGDKWNDYEEDSSGMMMIEAFAYVADLLLFYLDHQANETYLPTATERQNIINLCKLVGYNVAGAQPAQADVSMTLKGGVHAKDVRLPKGLRLETREGVVFETQQELVIPAGEASGTVSAIEGETFEETVGVSDGETNQEFYLPRSGVIQLLNLWVGAHEWSAVESVADHLGDEAVFMVDLDAWGRARISFGDGCNGRIPERDVKIKARYRVGGGTRGNVAPNTIVVMRDIATDEDGNRVGMDATNPTPASGGTELESLERIKLWAPQYYETQNRCVTQADYETIAMTFRHPDAGAIAKARAIVRERSGEANVIRYYVLAYSDEAGKVGLASQALKDALLSHVNKYKMLTDWIEVEDGAWRGVDIEGTVQAVGGMREDAVISSVRSALEKLFSLEVRGMGESLRISDIYSAIDGTEGVLHVELESPQATIEAEKNELLVLGEIRLSVKTDGEMSDGRISDLIPSLYREDKNELSPFVEALETETDILEREIKNLSDLTDVDRCPEKYLPYLAAMTDCRLIGNDPRLWRRQIRNWPWLLKIKGTEKSLAVFLQSIGVQDYTLHTWFRDASGNLVEEKPPGQPFFNHVSGQWHNARTHYFSVDMALGEDFASLRDYSQKEILALIWPWMERTKPFHAELLTLNVIPTPPDIAFEHGYGRCFYGECFYSGGWWPLPVACPVDGAALSEPLVMGTLKEFSLYGIAYSLAPVYGAAFYGDISRFGLRGMGLDEYIGFADRRFARYRDWRGQWLRRKWTDREFYWEPSPLSKCWSFSFAQGVYGAGEPMGSLNCVYAPGYWRYPEPPRYGSSAYGDLYPAPCFVPIDRYYDDRFGHYAPLNIEAHDFGFVVLFSPRALYEDEGWGGPWGGKWGFTKFPPRHLEAEGFFAHSVYGSNEVFCAESSRDESWNCAVYEEEIPVLGSGQESSLSFNTYGHRGWGGLWGGLWGIEYFPSPNIETEGFFGRGAYDRENWEVSGKGEDGAFVFLKAEQEDWDNPWGGQDESLLRGELGNERWENPSGEQDGFFFRAGRKRKGWGGIWRGLWEAERICAGPIMIIDEEA